MRKIRCPHCGTSYHYGQAILWDGIRYCPTCNKREK